MRKRPQQLRSKQMVATLVEATARCIVEHGLDGATTPRIAELAGVSVGSLYQYFDGKEALIEALLTRERRGQLEPVLSPEAQRVLMAYPWPGNIRQLDHVLRLALTLAEGEAVIGLQHLPEELLMETAGPGRRSATVAGDACLREIELEAVRAAMARNGGNVSATARSLGVARATLYRKLRLLGLA